MLRPCGAPESYEEKGSIALAPESIGNHLLDHARAARFIPGEHEQSVLGQLAVLVSDRFLLRQIPTRRQMMSFVREIWGFMRARKKFWLLPMLAMLLLLGGLMVLAQTSAIAPFIYSLF